jgi:acyl carrier protein
MEMRSEIISEFEEVARQQDRRLAPLSDDLELLYTGLDSLSFAIVVTRLEEKLGLDPFATSEGEPLPLTFGEFVEFYENAAK